MPNVTKKDLIDKIVDKTKVKRVLVKQIVQHFLDAVIDELGESHRIELRDFGVFEVKQRAPRLAQNPKTLEKVQVPAKKSVKFKPGRLMKQRVDAIADDGAPGDDGKTSGDDAPIVEVTDRQRERV